MYFLSITQVAELVQEVTRARIPVVTDRIVEVIHRSWDVTVKARAPESIPHSEEGFPSQDTDFIPSQPTHTMETMPDAVNSHIQPDSDKHAVEMLQSMPATYFPTVCTAKPSYRQDPHTGQLRL